MEVARYSFNVYREFGILFEILKVYSCNKNTNAIKNQYALLKVFMNIYGIFFPV